MGSFEKLGILVIVVIIVMILAVAIHQWGGAGAEAGVPGGAFGAGIPPASITPPGPIHRDIIDPLPSDPAGGRTPDPAVDGESWPGGIPRNYTIRANDRLWVLVVEQWGLKDSFTRAIEAANPRVRADRLQTGTVLVIPDPASYRAGSGAEADRAPGGTVEYEIQVGDRLDLIAKKHLGSYSEFKRILALNPGLNERALQPGQIIRLPTK